jgi:hypothetical protein
MFSLCVPTPTCPVPYRQHNRTSQSCSSVAPSGIGPNPTLAATWCGVSIRVPSYLLVIWKRPYPSDPTAPIHT